MERNLQIRTLLNHLFQRWPLLIVVGVLGGLIGLGLSYAFPPIYESKAIMSIGIDFDRDPPITQREQDRAESKVSALMKSDEVLEDVLAELAQHSTFEYTVPNLDELKALILIRKYFSEWHLFIPHHDPEFATHIVNVWAEKAEGALWDAYSHAQHAVNLQEQLDEVRIGLVELRLQGSAPGIADQIREVEGVMLDLEEQILEEVRLSQGVVTFLTFNLSNRAIQPDQPLTRARGDLIVAGIFLGLISTIAYFFVNWFTESSPEEKSEL